VESALRLVEDEVRELVRRRSLDPMSAPGEMRALIDDVVADYDERSLSGQLPRISDPADVARCVFDAIAGFGPLQALLDDREVEEIWVNEPGRVFAARKGVSELTTIVLTDVQLRDIVERMLKSSGRRIDLSTPFAWPSQHVQAPHPRYDTAC
jgi:pilus assembly protein CpaF